MNINVNGETKELSVPKWNMKLAKLQDVVSEKEKNEDIYKAQFDFLSEAYGKKQLLDILEAKSLDDCDLIVLQLAYLEVIDEIQRPLTEKQAERISSQIDSSGISEMLPVLNAIKEANK